VTKRTQNPHLYHAEIQVELINSAPQEWAELLREVMYGLMPGHRREWPDVRQWVFFGMILAHSAEEAEERAARALRDFPGLRSSSCEILGDSGEPPKSTHALLMGW